MKGKVENISKSKSQKTWRVKVDGGYYGANFDSNLDTAVGKIIDFTYEDGEFGKWIKSWAYAGNPTPIQSQPDASYPKTLSEASGTLSDPELRFISNVVGQAIASKTLNDPIQIAQWAKAARQVLKELA